MNVQKQTALGEFIMKLRPAPLAALLKRLLRIQRLEFATPHGTFWIDPASYQGLSLLRDGRYEPDMLETVLSSLQPGDVFVDVGANEGYFTVVAAGRVGAGGRVLAIEPQERLKEVIARNCTLNGCRNVTQVAAAVSDREGEASLYLTPDVNNSASSLQCPTRYGLPRQTVASRTLESLFKEHGISRCRLMKIDVEGWEYEAVLGSRDLFASGRVEALALELHPHLLAARGLRAEDITEFLFRCGYRQAEKNHLLLVRDSAQSAQQ